MSNEFCKCGHSRNEHFDFIDRLDEKRNTYWQYVAKGLGKCQKCDCKEFLKV